MKSMTGYGEATVHGRRTTVAVQIRSLNHRHLDIQLRVPREFLPLEEEIRQRIRRCISRGRIEVFVNRSATQDQGRRVELDEVLAGHYLKLLRHARKKFGLKGELELSSLLQLPDLFYSREAPVAVGDEQAMVLKAVERALKNLERARLREGQHLKRDLESGVRALQAVSAALTRLARELLPPHGGVAASEDGGNEAFREAPEAGRSPAKGDIHEEVIRLKSHVGQLGLLVRGREPVGKKIDFLLQEVQRELNTISSKMPQLEVVNRVVAGKEQVEKVREQVQNVE